MYYATGLPGWQRYGRYAAPGVLSDPYVEPDPALEKRALKNQADALQTQLDLVNKRLSNLETDTD